MKDGTEILRIMGERHTLQILDVLDNLGADWMKKGSLIAIFRLSEDNEIIVEGDYE